MSARRVVGVLTVLAWAAALPGEERPASSPAAAAWRAVPSGTSQTLMGVWGRSARDVHVVGHGLVLHHDGSAWTTTPVAGRLAAVGGSADDVFASGEEGLLLRCREDGWRAVPSGVEGNIDGLWGVSAKDVFAVADDGSILRWDGTTWTAETGDGKPLAGVWGASARDVFAVGFEGTVLHRDGRAWSPMVSGTREHLTGVWGSSGRDVFAVGFGGTILRYDGTRWTPMPQAATGQPLTRVWGRSPDDVYAVGAAGTILHFDGRNWSAMASGSTAFLTGVWGTAEGVFAVGSGETLLHLPTRGSAGGRNP